MNESSPSSGPALQFEQAEFAAAPAVQSCTSCASIINDEYFERGGRILCRPCSENAAGKHAGKAAFWRAAGWGFGAAVLGTIVWFLVKLTGYELGIVAIGVGILVGKAVNKGARDASGWKYRALAMALTYASITTSYVPDVVKFIAEQSEKGKAEANAKREAGGAATTGTEGAGKAAPGASAVKAAPGASEAPGTPAPSTFLAIVIFVALVFGLAFAMPFLAGFENIMGIIIIGIALWEAWKLTAPVPVTGPFKIAPAAPTATPAAAP